MSNHCLIVDDDPAIRQLISRAVTTYGVTSSEMSSAEELLNFASIGHPAAIFLDVSLAGSDAIDAIRGLAEMRFSGAIQLMSGHRAVLEDVKKVGERHGLYMRKPIAKPFRLEAIRAVIQEEGLTQMLPAQRPVSLAEALKHKWLELWYQPKIDLRTRMLAGAEGLIRVRHPDFDVIAPDVFLETASGSEMLQLAEFVFTTALCDWIFFSQAGLNLKLSVNLSTELLTALPVPALIREFRPVEASWPGLIIDVPEAEISRDPQLVHEAATQWRIHKVGLAIDDFRSGYSNMIDLRALPFEELKFDRDFVRNCVSGRQKNVGVAVAHMVHQLGRLVVAEGIENASEIPTLLQVGCDFGQGYSLSPAVERDRLIATAVKRAKRMVPV